MEIYFKPDPILDEACFNHVSKILDDNKMMIVAASLIESDKIEAMYPGDLKAALRHASRMFVMFSMSQRESQKNVLKLEAQIDSMLNLPAGI